MDTNIVQANIMGSITTITTFISTHLEGIIIVIIATVVSGIILLLLKKGWGKVKSIRQEAKEKERIKKAVFSQLENQIKKQINSTKYIPDTFIEISSIKEKCRYFIDPVLFYKKLLERIKILDYRYLNMKIAKLRRKLKPFHFKLPLGFTYKKVRLQSLASSINSLDNFLTKKENDLISYKQYVDENWSYFYIKQIERKFDDIKEYLGILKSKILLILDDAGQGKTNFVCDLANKYIKRKDILSLFFTGSEFNDIGSNNNMEKIVIKRTFQDFVNENFCGFIEKIETLCYKENKVFVIIIDGLNENTNPDGFSQKLESFIENLIKYDFIKVILTCRTQYYNEKFRNLEGSSFANHITKIEGLNERMTDKEKLKLFRAYMRYFKVSGSHIGDYVYNLLVDNFLLLRIFAETYESQNVGNLFDIYKDDLFRRYFEKKCEEIKKKEADIDFKQIFEAIIVYMINKEIFTNVPLNDIVASSGVNKNDLIKLIDENILIRRDLREYEYGVFGNEEVINFTFDEFRDYLITFFLLEKVYKDKPKDFEVFIDKYVIPDSSLFEGISKFLFYTSKRKKDDNLKAILEQKEWFGEKYIDYILSTNDEYITEEDIDKLKNKFLENIQSSSKISTRLIRLRFDTETFKNLNINTLFDILMVLNQSEYDELFSKVFEVSYIEDRHGIYKDRPYKHWNIRHLVDDFNKILENENLSIRKYYHKLFESLIFLLDVEFDRSPYHDTFDLYQDYAEKYPNEALAQLISRVSINNDSIRSRIWRLLSSLSRKDIHIPKDFILKTINTLMAEKPNPKTQNTSSYSTMIDFLILYKDKEMFSEEQIKYLEDNKRCEMIARYEKLALSQNP